MTENEISYRIRKAIFEVYNSLGPGLLESVYHKALAVELRQQGLHVEIEFPVSVIYKEKDLGLAFRIDILVENRVLIEIKSVTELLPLHHKQVLNYLKLTKMHLGILVNFNTKELPDNIVRLVNGYN